MSEARVKEFKFRKDQAGNNGHEDMCKSGCYSDMHIIFRFDVKNRRQIVFDIKWTQTQLGRDLCRLLLFAHAVGGCGKQLAADFGCREVPQLNLKVQQWD
nr:hypothetical protein BaRGS_017379 [Batillaria attramentaria]